MTLISHVTLERDFVHIWNFFEEKIRKNCEYFYLLVKTTILGALILLFQKQKIVQNKRPLTKIFLVNSSFSSIKNRCLANRSQLMNHYFGESLSSSYYLYIIIIILLPHLTDTDFHFSIRFSIFFLSIKLGILIFYC